MLYTGVGFGRQCASSVRINLMTSSRRSGPADVKHQVGIIHVYWVQNWSKILTESRHALGCESWKCMKMLDILCNEAERWLLNWQKVVRGVRGSLCHDGCFCHTVGPLVVGWRDLLWHSLWVHPGRGELFLAADTISWQFRGQWIHHWSPELARARWAQDGKRGMSRAHSACID